MCSGTPWKWNQSRTIKEDWEMHSGTVILIQTQKGRYTQRRVNVCIFCVWKVSFLCREICCLLLHRELCFQEEDDENSMPSEELWICDSHAVLKCWTNTKKWREEKANLLMFTDNHNSLNHTGMNICFTHLIFISNTMCEPTESKWHNLWTLLCF